MREIIEDCGCEEQRCSCTHEHPTICIIHEGVELGTIDVYEGEDLESILKKIDNLFKEITTILYEGKLFINVGRGAEVLSKVNAQSQAEIRSLLSGDGIDVVKNIDDIGFSINEEWLANFITNNSPSDKTTTISNLISGKRIATYTNERGTKYDIKETVTKFELTAGKLIYTDEEGVSTPIDVSSVISVATFSNLVSGHVIATHKNGNGGLTSIRETITGITDNGDNTFNYKNESGETQPFSVLSASTLKKGILRISSADQVQNGMDNNTAVSPLGLSSRTATETRSGLLEVATAGEANAMQLDNKIVTPAKIPIASTSQKGVTQAATIAEVRAGGSTTKYVTPSSLDTRLNDLGIINMVKVKKVLITSWSKDRGILNVRHDIGSSPISCSINLICKSAEGGYSVGDKATTQHRGEDQDGRFDYDYGIGVEFSRSTTFDISIGDRIKVGEITSSGANNAFEVDSSKWNIEVVFLYM